MPLTMLLLKCCLGCNVSNANDFHWNVWGTLGGTLVTCGELSIDLPIRCVDFVD
ncbi:hypothetical protein M758_UG316200 [Ceratodon purpureus]|nr:hypothetical protein M758_UG316200 [Ceratodon purpureus]